MSYPIDKFSDIKEVLEKKPRQPMSMDVCCNCRIKESSVIRITNNLFWIPSCEHFSMRGKKNGGEGWGPIPESCPYQLEHTVFQKPRHIITYKQDLELIEAWVNEGKAIITYETNATSYTFHIVFLDIENNVDDIRRAFKSELYFNDSVYTISIDGSREKDLAPKFTDEQKRFIVKKVSLKNLQTLLSYVGMRKAYGRPKFKFKFKG